MAVSRETAHPFLCQLSL